MSGVFNWSVKQLFLWVSVEYWDKECGEKLGLDAPGCHQEVVIWDKIIEHPKDAKLHMVSS